MVAKGKHYTWERTWSSKEILSLIQNDKIVQAWMSRLFWMMKNSLKTNQVHFDCLNRQSKWVTLVLALSQICTGTCTHRQQKKGFHCLHHFQHALNGRVVLTWRNGFRARETDTITPPSIIGLREESKSPIRELEKCGADRWINSLKAEREGGKGDDREDRSETDCWSPLHLSDGMRIVKSQSHRASGGLRGGREGGFGAEGWQKWEMDFIKTAAWLSGFRPLLCFWPSVFRAGKVVCVLVCVRTGSVCYNDRWAIHCPPPEWPMPFHSRPGFISANVLLEEHHCPLSADWAGLGWTQLYRASPD